MIPPPPSPPAAPVATPHRRLYFVGAPHTTPHGVTDPLERLKHTGANTGNLLIGYGARRHLDALETSGGLKTEPERVRERFECIIIPAANFLGRHTDFGFLADFIERCDLPCCTLGLGVQTPSYDSPVELTPGTRRFLDVIAERSVRLGARGNFSAEHIHKLGVKNVEPIGCPSLYINREFELTMDIGRLASFAPVGINGSHQSHEHSMRPADKRQVEARLFAAAIQRGWYYLLQDEKPELTAAHGGAPEAEAELDKRLAATWPGAGTAEELRAYFRKYGRAFFTVPEWLEFVDKFAFVIGTRLHGVVAAAQVRTPFLLFTHDARTLEVAELADLPRLPIEEAAKLDLSPEGIARLARATDYRPFERRRRELLLRFRNFLEDHRLGHSLYFTRAPAPGFRRNWQNC